MIQLVYVSAAHPLFTPADIADILEVSRRNNARDTITGLLVYKSGSVIQFLEGPPEAVRTLFAAICRDRRHCHVTKIYEEEISQRDFPDWTMGFRETDGAFPGRPDGYNAILTPGFDWSTLESSKVRVILQAFMKEIR